MPCLASYVNLGVYLNFFLSLIKCILSYFLLPLRPVYLVVAVAGGVFVASRGIFHCGA